MNGNQILKEENDMKEFKGCLVCEGSGTITQTLFDDVNGGFYDRKVSCPVCLKKRYEKKIKHLKDFYK